MRVRILRAPPMAPDHGMRRERVCDVLRVKPAEGRRPAGYWVMGDEGKPVLLLENETKVEED